MPSSPRIILLMGVAGSGKTTIGRQLADLLGWPYHEADDFHPAANKEKMAQGHPLDDQDRSPWLAAIRTALDDCRSGGQNAVFSCSALKEKYRRVLMSGRTANDVSLVFLTGDRDLLLSRLQARSGHYMKPAMLESQLAILEPPAGALCLDIKATPDELVTAIRRHCGI